MAIKWPSPQISLQSETTLDGRAPDGLLASCPTIDLSASWDKTSNTLLIYRPPDQVVSKIYQQIAGGERSNACAIAWKPDGQFIAVGWEDGFVRLMSLENSKAAHHLAVTAPGTGPSPSIVRIAWVSNRVDSGYGAKPLKASTQHSLGHLFRTTPIEINEADGNCDAALSEIDELDLPTELTFVEVEASMPKISPLPSGSAGSGADALVFTSRTGIEFLFQPLKREDMSQVHVMLVGFDDGSLHLSICDSFSIGTFSPSDIVSSASTPAAPRLLSLHASHSDVSTHALVLRSSSDPSSVYLTPMDLPFVVLSPANLALLASRLTTLQKLLRYIGQTQLHMHLEYKNTREIPARYIRVVQEELEKAPVGGPRDIVQALYHSAVTGHVGKDVKEWLLESVNERGHKRWDKAVKSGLENLRSLVHENLLPSLDRASAILSRLRGLALFYASPSLSGSSSDIGFTADEVSRIADAVAALILAGHKMLLLIMEELDLFAVFSAWLNIRIGRAASTQAPDDAAQEKEANIETGKVLAYIQRYLVPKISPEGEKPYTTTPLGVFLDDAVTEEDINKSIASMETSNLPPLMPLVDAQVSLIECRAPYDRVLPSMAFLVALITRRADGIFSAIAETQRRSVAFGAPTRLAMATRGAARAVGGVDATMAAGDEQVDDGRRAYVHVAMTPTERENELWLFETTLHISYAGTSETLGTRVCPLTIPGGPGGAYVLHAKFLNERVLAVLFRESKDAPGLRLLTLPLVALSHAYSDHSGRTTTTSSAPRPRALDGADILGPEGFQRLCVDVPTGPTTPPVDNTPPNENKAQEKGKTRARAKSSASTMPVRKMESPLRMEAHDVSEVRGRVAARVCLLGQSGGVWTTYALEV